MKDLVTFLLKSIVTHPEHVVVEENIGTDDLIRYDLHVNPEDMGEVIGKGGRIIKAIRSIVRAASLKQGKRIHLDLVEAPTTK